MSCRILLYVHHPWIYVTSRRIRDRALGVGCEEERVIYPEVRMFNYCLFCISGIRLVHELRVSH